ncbi:MAG: 1-deoxy-D-xylulose-5-phosphate reductoisomerase, partial [Lentisphaeria bacterium]|nr:1-deoxy-D-xylulose-5-phosphate reductoisomerase [Lentisphaeria bacterium]
FADGSILAQMGHPDMRLPIQYCLTYPERQASQVRRMDFRDLFTLQFEPPDHGRFPALRLAREAMQAGGSAPCVFNAANEVAVERFLAGRLPFPGIWAVAEEVLARTPPECPGSLAGILAADRAARAIAAGVADRLGGPRPTERK